jgi:hypothetical protein
MITDRPRTIGIQPRKRKVPNTKGKGLRPDWEKLRGIVTAKNQMTARPISERSNFLTITTQIAAHPKL